MCRSDSDPKCADPFDNSTVPITDCKQEPDLEHLPGVRPTMCRKIRQKGYLSIIILCSSTHIQLVYKNTNLLTDDFIVAPLYFV